MVSIKILNTISGKITTIETPCVEVRQTQSGCIIAFNDIGSDAWFMSPLFKLVEVRTMDEVTQCSCSQCRAFREHDYS
jgi:hypothetical protein